MFIWIITIFKFFANVVGVLQSAMQVYKFADDNNLWTKTKRWVKKKFSKKRKS